MTAFTRPSPTDAPRKSTGEIPSWVTWTLILIGYAAEVAAFHLVLQFVINDHELLIYALALGFAGISINMSIQLGKQLAARREKYHTYSPVRVGLAAVVLIGMGAAAFVTRLLYVRPADVQVGTSSSSYGTAAANPQNLAAGQGTTSNLLNAILMAALFFAAATVTLIKVADLHSPLKSDEDRADRDHRNAVAVLSGARAEDTNAQAVLLSKQHLRTVNDALHVAARERVLGQALALAAAARQEMATRGLTVQDVAVASTGPESGADPSPVWRRGHSRGDHIAPDPAI